MLTAEYLILCEKVITDDQTKKPSYINAFADLNAPQIPAQMNGLAVCALCRTKNTKDQHKLRFKVISPNKEETILYDMENILAPSEHLFINFVANTFIFNMFGNYQFQIEEKTKNGWKELIRRELALTKKPD